MKDENKKVNTVLLEAFSNISTTNMNSLPSVQEVISEAVKKQQEKEKELEEENLETKKIRRNVNPTIYPTTEENEEKNLRTIFVGNVPLQTNTKKLLKKLKKHFESYGKIESVRLRNLGFTKPNLSSKINFINQNFHPERDSANAYIVFKELESVEKAQKENGSLFEGKHLRVDKAKYEKQDMFKNTVFVGGLPVNITEEDLWNCFESAGKITNVHIVRTKVGIGKGVAFVSFSTMEAVQVALQNNSEFGGKKINVEIAKKNYKKSQKMQEKKRTPKRKTQDQDKPSWQGETAIKGNFPHKLRKLNKLKSKKRKEFPEKTTKHAQKKAKRQNN